MSTVKIGDEVRVFRSRRCGDDEGGIPAKVTKVGRKWGTAAYEVDVHDWRGNTSRRTEAIEFGLETGYERGDQFGNGYQVKTLERLEQERRSVAAVTSLRKAGISFDGVPFRHVEFLEALAEVAKTFTEGEQ